MTNAFESFCGCVLWYVRPLEQNLVISYYGSRYKNVACSKSCKNFLFFLLGIRIRFRIRRVFVFLKPIRHGRNSISALLPEHSTE